MKDELIVNKTQHLMKSGNQSVIPAYPVSSIFYAVQLGGGVRAWYAW